LINGHGFRGKKLTWILALHFKDLDAWEIQGLDWIQKTRVDQVFRGWMVFRGLDRWFSWIGWMVFMDGINVFHGRLDGFEGFFLGWIGVFPSFQRSASILSKDKAPFCNLKIQLFHTLFLNY